MNGGATGSGAPKGNRNAHRHGLFTAAIAERKEIQAVLGPLAFTLALQSQSRPLAIA